MMDKRELLEKLECKKDNREMKTEVLGWEEMPGEVGKCGFGPNGWRWAGAGKTRVQGCRMLDPSLPAVLGLLFILPVPWRLGTGRVLTFTLPGTGPYCLGEH